MIGFLPPELAHNRHVPVGLIIAIGACLDINLILLQNINPVWIIPGVVGDSPLSVDSSMPAALLTIK